MVQLSIHLSLLCAHVGDAFSTIRIPAFPLLEDLYVSDHRWSERNVEEGLRKYGSVHFVLINTIVRLSLCLIVICCRSFSSEVLC